MCPVEAEIFHAGRRADKQTVMTKPAVAFRNFAKAPVSARTNFSRRQFSPYTVSTNEMNVLI